MSVSRVVVVGAGLAGLQTVVALRAQGFAGGLTLVGAEDEAPYDRPPLSKALLAGATDGTTLEADWSALDTDLRISTTVASVGDGVVATDQGGLPFDGLVLATGAQPRRLAGADSALTLRTRADAAGHPSQGLARRRGARPGLSRRHRRRQT